MNGKNRQQILAILAVAAFALLIGDKVIFTPLTELWKARAEKISELTKQIKTGEATLQRESVVRRRWEQMRGNTLPGKPSLAQQQVLEAFDFWMRDSRINITSITPQWKQESDDYLTLECRVDAAGTLENLCKFLYLVEKDPMALKMQSIELAARDNAGQQMTLGLQLSGLVLVSPKP